MDSINFSFFSINFFANFFYYHGLKFLEPGKASIVASLEPVIAAITAYFFLGEYFSRIGYIFEKEFLTNKVLSVRYCKGVFIS